MASQPDPEQVPFWRALLSQRRTVRFGNFAWLSIDTLLLASNDQIIKKIEDHRTGASVVDRRRMRWVAQQRDRGVRAEEPVSLPHCRGLLMLGDPGEMDASQYVLVKDLATKCQELKQRSIDSVLLMSDVVYPAGDVNTWADAVYLPYYGLPKGAWQDAESQTTNLDTNPNGQNALAAPFAGMRVFAMPGNHDWYDGLNGFMYHACGAEPLPEIAYEDNELSWRARAVRRWWRNPAEPERELLWDLREDAQNIGHPVKAGDDFIKRAAVNPARTEDGLPNVKGPYYALDLGGQPGAPLLRVVVVDTGVSASIDLEQAAVVRRWLSTPGVPKVLVTGVPLMVNNKLRTIPIAQAQARDERDRRLFRLPDGTPASVPHSLLDLMRDGQGVIATIAGDTHNYQRIQNRLDGGDELVVGKKWKTGLPPVQIVAGGAGAYLSATHVIDKSRGVRSVEQVNAENAKDREDGNKPLEPDAGGNWTVNRLREYPEREESVVHYFKNLRGPWYFALLSLLLVVAGLLTWWASRTPTAPHAGRELVVHALVVLVPLLWAVALYFLARSKSWKRGLLYTLVGAGLLGIANISYHYAWGKVSVGSVAVGVAAMVFTTTALLGPSLIRAVPDLIRVWPVRVVALGLVVALQRGTGEAPLRFIAYALAAYALLLGAGRILNSSVQELQRRHLIRPSTPGACALFVLQAMPTVTTAGGIFVAAAVFPGQLLEAFGLPRDLAGLIRRDTLSVDVVALLLLPLFGLGLPLWKQRRTVPKWLLTAPLLTGVAVGFLAGIWVVKTDGGWSSAITASLTSLVIVALLEAAVLLFFGAWQALPANDARVAAALKLRDGDEARRSDLATAARMVISSIPSIDSMAEATTPPFHKNILTLEVRQETSDSSTKPITVVTLTAESLDDESRDDDSNSGFQFLDQVTIRYEPDGSVTPPGP